MADPPSCYVETNVLVKSDTALHCTQLETSREIFNYFQDQNQSGGGKTFSLIYVNDNEFIVPFMHIEDAMNVVKKKSHIVTSDGAEYRLKTEVCPNSYYPKYVVGMETIRGEDDLESFALVSRGEIQMCDKNGKPLTEMHALELDGRNSENIDEQNSQETKNQPQNLMDNKEHKEENEKIESTENKNNNGNKKKKDNKKKGKKAKKGGSKMKDASFDGKVDEGVSASDSDDDDDGDVEVEWQKGKGNVNTDAYSAGQENNDDDDDADDDKRDGKGDTNEQPECDFNMKVGLSFSGEGAASKGENDEENMNLEPDFKVKAKLPFEKIEGGADNLDLNEEKLTGETNKEVNIDMVAGGDFGFTVKLPFGPETSKEKHDDDDSGDYYDADDEQTNKGNPDFRMKVKMPVDFMESATNDESHDAIGREILENSGQNETTVEDSEKWRQMEEWERTGQRTLQEEERIETRTEEDSNVESNILIKSDKPISREQLQKYKRDILDYFEKTKTGGKLVKLAIVNEREFILGFESVKDAEDIIHKEVHKLSVGGEKYSVTASVCPNKDYAEHVVDIEKDQEIDERENVESNVLIKSDKPISRERLQKYKRDILGYFEKTKTGGKLVKLAIVNEREFILGYENVADAEDLIYKEVHKLSVGGDKYSVTASVCPNKDYAEYVIGIEEDQEIDERQGQEEFTERREEETENIEDDRKETETQKEKKQKKDKQNKQADSKVQRDISEYRQADNQTDAQRQDEAKTKGKKKKNQKDKGGNVKAETNDVKNQERVEYSADSSQNEPVNHPDLNDESQAGGRQRNLKVDHEMEQPATNVDKQKGQKKKDGKAEKVDEKNENQPERAESKSGARQRKLVVENEADSKTQEKIQEKVKQKQQEKMQAEEKMQNKAQDQKKQKLLNKEKKQEKVQEKAKEAGKTKSEDSKKKEASKPASNMADEDEELTLRLEEEVNRTIFLPSIPAGLADTVELYLESKKYGGGDVDGEVEFNEDKTQATATFVDPRVARAFLEQGFIQVKNHKIEITEVLRNDHPTEEEPEEDFFSILVEGIEDEDFVELYFENKRKSGGGEIESHQKIPGTSKTLVTFKSQEDAESVLSRQHEYKGKSLIVTRPSKESLHPSLQSSQSASSLQQAPPPPTSILVDGEDLDVELVRMFFESKKRSGGGTVVDVKVMGQRFMVIFENSEVVESVMKKHQEQPLKLKDRILQISLPITDSETSLKQSFSQSASSLVEAPPPPTSILVAGARNVEEQVVKMFFENKKRAGGGPVNDIRELGEGEGRFVVTFENYEVVESVMKKHSDSPLTLGGNTLEISVIPFQPAGRSSSSSSLLSITGMTSCAIRVSGLAIEGQVLELMKLFFENRKRSGGGGTVEIVRTEDGNSAVIVFEDAEVVDRVLQQHRQEPFTLHQVKVKVEILKPLPVPSIPPGELSPTSLLCRGITSIITPSDIRSYFDRRMQWRVKQLTYCLQPDVVMIEFNLEIDYCKAVKITGMFPVGPVMVSLERVPIPHSVIIYNCGNISPDALQLFLESRNGANTEDVVVHEKKDDKCMIAEFKDSSVLGRLLNSEKTFSGQRLEFHVYHECLGILPPDVDTSQPISLIPAEVVLKFDPEIMEYIQKDNSELSELENLLLPEHCVAQFSTKKGEIVLQCDLKKNSPELAKLSKHWGQICAEKTKTFMAEFAIKEVNVLQDYWAMLKERLLADMKSRSATLPSVTFDDGVNSIVIVGRKKPCEDLEQDSKKLMGDIAQEMEMKKKMVKEKIGFLKRHQLQLLKATQFFDVDPSKETGVRVTFDGAIPVFEGLGGDVTNKKLSMFETLNVIVSENFKPDEHLVQLWKEKNFMEHLQGVLMSMSIRVVWEMGSQGVTVYGMSQKEVDDGIKAMKKVFVYREISLNEQNRLALQHAAWQERKEQFISKNTIIVEETATCLKIYTTEDDANGTIEIISNFIEEYTVLNKSVRVRKGQFIIITKYMTTDLDNIKDAWKSSFVRIEFKEPTFHIFGTKHGLPGAEKGVKSLVEKVLIVEKEINRPGMAQHFLTVRGKETMQSIQSRHNVYIENVDEVPENPEEENSNDQELTARYPDGNICCVALLEHAVTVSVVDGDIVKCNVDVVVNAANGDLKHVGGVAKSICDAAGYAIQAECDEYISRNGRIMPANFYVSQAGKLNVKVIFHVVGPIWQSGHSNEENILYQAVANVLEEAEKQGYKSIALPAISTGIYGFPLNKACKIILDAIKDFAKKAVSNYGAGSLCDIRIVDSSPTVIDMFNRTMTQVYGDRVTQTSGGEQGAVGGVDLRRSGTRYSGRRSEPDMSESWWGKSSYMNQSVVDDDDDEDDDKEDDNDTVSHGLSRSIALPTNRPNVLKTPNGLTITLAKGSIADETTDAILNTTNHNVQLGNGAVSSSILKAAGAAMQAEATQKAPNGLPPKKILITQGYNLNCSEVYHSNCLQWDNGAGPSEEEWNQFYTRKLSREPQIHMNSFNPNYALERRTHSSVRKVVQLALEQANQTGHNSFSFPAIGTGNLKIPHDLAAQWMLEEIENFSDKNQGASLNNVRIVVYPTDHKSVTAFESEMKNPQRGGGGGRAVAGGPATGTRESRRKLQTKKGKAAWANSGTESGLRRDPSGWSIKIGDVTVEVCQGDITKETSDAIVNSTNNNLDLSLGSVSQSIIKQGGRKIQDDCMEIINSGGVKDGLAVTSAGKLPCRFIFHLVTGHGHGKWNQKIDKCLQEADSRKLSSISFPLLGTGNIGKSAGDMAGTMLESIAKFSSKATTLRTIRITIFEQAMVNEFADAIDKKLNSTTGFFGRAKGMIKTFMGLGAQSPELEVRDLPKERLCGFDTTVKLRFFALQERDISYAVKDIEDHCTNTIKEKIIQGGNVGETIAKLKPAQIDAIKALEEKHLVSITVEQKGLNRIRIRGESDFVMEVSDKIYEIFRSVDQAEREEEEQKVAEVLAKQVRWMYMEGGNYVEYPIEINRLIEMAFQNQQTSIEWAEQDGKFSIDFKQEKEFKTGSAAAGTKVKRMVIGDTSTVPSHWDQMKANAKTQRVKLQAGTAEYTAVEQAARATASTALNNIISIERIQAPSLYQQYMVKKNHMEKSATHSLPIERKLWHGTSSDTLESIEHGGFNRSYCGKNATVYGRGVYFATNFSYSGSNTYAVPDATTGYKYVYQTAVLTGEFVQGHQSYIVPPNKPGASSTAECYDSVVDNQANPSVFVIFNDTQAYPEYLITFT